MEDENYVRRARKEDELCENREDGLPKDPNIMVKIISEKSFVKLSGLSEDVNETEMIDWLRNQRIYIAEAVWWDTGIPMQQEKTGSLKLKIWKGKGFWNRR